MITASVVIFNTERGELLNLLDCLKNNNIDLVFIIDNSLHDDMREVLSDFSYVIYSWGHGNVGYGAGHNIAIKKAMNSGSKYHLIVNSDIIFKSGVINKLKDYLDNNLDVGQVMPKVIYPSGDLQYLCKLIPTPLDLFLKLISPTFLFTKRMDRFQLKFTGYSNEMNVPYLSGCFMFFRIGALKEIGLFDERFFMYPEDIDITRRMHEKYKTMFYPDVQIIHAHAAESKKNIRMLLIHIVNMIKYFNKWGWVFDKKRRQINKTVLNDLKYK